MTKKKNYLGGIGNTTNYAPFIKGAKKRPINRRRTNVMGGLSTITNYSQYVRAVNKQNSLLQKLVKGLGFGRTKSK